MIVMIDNYDSFTYNLVQYFGELGEEIKVFRNDKITIEEIEALKPDRIVISPGPCDPSKAGISLAVIKHFAGKLPILGSLSWTPKHRAGFWRQNSPCEEVDAWENLYYNSHR